ncbi:hypothetical protein [Mitsuaria sp. 7]|uniref:hypothetical protein n=1 Tax=Mitsuaria sp. 7 TaxID=1658665 RepID=UPI0012F85CFB|nr:hypothetical protein [Mitsuaria sp. 7]
MIVEALFEFIVQPIVEIVIQLSGFCTAWLLLPVFTLGRVRVEPSTKGFFVKPGRGRIVKQRGGYYLMEAELASLYGLLIWAVIGFVFLLVRQ